MRPMEGQHVVLTGPTSGIGRATALALARLGARLSLVCRDELRGEAVASEVRACGAPDPAVVLCDLASQREVRAAAARLLERGEPIHVLLHNAGTIEGAFRLTSDGVERTMAVNHLAPMLLTSLLERRLRASAPSRVVVVSSVVHRWAALDTASFTQPAGFAPLRAYARSKLANALFAVELARRLEGSGVMVNAVHPGLVATGLGVRSGPGWLRALMPLAGVVLSRPERGASTSVHVASSEEGGRVTGAYFERSRVSAFGARALDPDLARRVWDECARLAGLSSELAS